MVQKQMAQLASMAAAPKTFGSLAVRERVITTDGLAISIDNIATVASFEDTKRLWLLTLLGALGALIAAFGQRSVEPGALVVAVILAALTAYLWWKRNSYRLVISTSDGTRTHFTGPDPKLIDEVRDFITRKIDQKDPNLTLIANFENGKIENLHVGQINAGTLVAGNNNQVAANSPGARVGTTETTNSYTATNSPGAQVGKGNVARGNVLTAPVTQTITRIDYSTVLPEVERWHRSAAGSPGWEHVAERLSRLEALLRDGTPATEQKHWARDLAVELSQLLQSYPAAVQLFEGVRRLIGL